MRACLVIDKEALAYNVKLLKHLNKKAFFCPMVKANSYGHGVEPISKVLLSQGVQKLGVVSVEEALEIAHLGKVIYIYGPFNKNQVEIISSHKFIPVIGHWENLKDLFNTKTIISFHLKFNLGMNRLGFSISDIPKIIDKIKKHNLLKLTGICSHLNSGETATCTKANPETSKQIEVFKKIKLQFQKSFKNSVYDEHLLASAGWWSLWSHSHPSLNLGFRPGLSLYGTKPNISFESASAQNKFHSVKLKNTSCLKSFVVRSITIKKGEAVSYGKTWKAKQKSQIAIVSMGYADGLPYSLSNKTEVLFRGKRVPIVGAICMDFFMIDVTNRAHSLSIKRGEEVVIFGSQQGEFIPIEEQSKKARIVPHNLFTNLGRRVKRVYV